MNFGKWSSTVQYLIRRMLSLNPVQAMRESARKDTNEITTTQAQPM